MQYENYGPTFSTNEVKSSKKKKRKKDQDSDVQNTDTCNLLVNMKFPKIYNNFFIFSMLIVFEIFLNCRKTKLESSLEVHAILSPIQYSQDRESTRSHKADCDEIMDDGSESDKSNTGGDFEML